MNALGLKETKISQPSLTHNQRPLQTEASNREVSKRNLQFRNLFLCNKNITEFSKKLT
jgi:hypothetical protein